MGVNDLFKEIKQLPIDQRIWLIEKTIKSIRKNNFEKEMLMAAESLSQDYHNDGELTVFTELDFENFYETR